jgi:hypothetical protein
VTRLVFAVALALAPCAYAGDGRLLIGDSAEPIDTVVIGLQRTAVPIVPGLVVDTATLADAALALNGGLRYGQAFGSVQVVAGARWVQFVGSGVYGSWVKDHAPEVSQFDSSMHGPEAYGAIGEKLGKVLIQAQVRYQHFSSDSLTVLGGVVVPLFGDFGLVVEAGGELLHGAEFRGAAGVRYAGQHFGFSLGAAYLHLSDPLLGDFPVTPECDLSWSF